MENRTSSWRSRIVGHGLESPADLDANPKNWRRHPRPQREALATLLDEVGWVQDVIVNRRSGLLVDGHLRVALAADHGEATIPVVYVDLGEDEEALVLAALDPIGAMAVADRDILESLISELPKDAQAVNTLLDAVAASAGLALDEPAAGVGDPDEAPPSPPSPVTRRGDVWELGPHRVMCGDATSASDAAILLDGERPLWTWTDPPYGVAYSGKTSAALRLQNDSAGTIRELLDAAFAVTDTALEDGAAIYVAHPAGPLAIEFGAAFLAVGWHFHQTLVWVKDTFVLGHSAYHYRHEPIIFGWKGQRAGWHGGRDQASVFEVARPKRSLDHPTMKPVALIEAHLRNSTARGDLGYDPFGGSGSTLVAAHRLGRRCAAMEIDPRYVDVTVRRWQQHAGADAMLRADGRTFEQTQEERRGR